MGGLLQGCRQRYSVTILSAQRIITILWYSLLLSFCLTLHILRCLVCLVVKPHLIPMGVYCVPGPFVIPPPHRLSCYLKVLTCSVSGLLHVTLQSPRVLSGGIPVVRSTGRWISRPNIRYEGVNSVALCSIAQHVRGPLTQPCWSSSQCLASWVIRVALTLSTMPSLWAHRGVMRAFWIPRRRQHSLKYPSH